MLYLAAGIAAGHIVKRIVCLCLFLKCIWFSGTQLCRENVSAEHLAPPATPAASALAAQGRSSRDGFTQERNGIAERAGHAAFPGVFQWPCFLWSGTFFSDCSQMISR